MYRFLNEGQYICDVYFGRNLIVKIFRYFSESIGYGHNYEYNIVEL